VPVARNARGRQLERQEASGAKAALVTHQSAEEAGEQSQREGDWRRQPVLTEVSGETRQRRCDQQRAKGGKQ
jgi:hypothetical protein